MDVQMIKQGFQSRLITPYRVLEVSGMTYMVSQCQGVLEESIKVYGGLGTPQHDQEILVTLRYGHHALSLCFLLLWV